MADLRLGDLPDQAARRWGDREALSFEGRRWSHAEFAAEVDRVAKGLIGLGIAPGEHVAVWLDNRPEWLFLMYAIAKAGAVIVPLNTRYRADDLAYALGQSDCATLIAAGHAGPVDYAALIAEARPNLDRLILLGPSDLANAISWEALIAGAEAIETVTLADRAAAVRADDPMMILYTSGTTSSPKGAVHSHAGIRNTAARARLQGVTEADVVMGYLPLFHIYGFSEVALTAVLTGARQVLMARFDADRALDLAEAEGATICQGFDVHWLDLLAAQQARPRRLNWHFGTFPTGTEAAAGIAGRVHQVFGPTFSGFGMTETWAFIACGAPGDTPE